jgi:D-glycero-D-manno-heptose 1,7-bisphosphate phosphatase
MKKAVFLDRDGVINVEVGDYIKKIEDFFVLEHAVVNIKKLHAAGYKIIVITNQGGIAKGMYTLNELHSMHDKMLAQFHAEGADVDEVYYCPHHPDFGMCLCRKPSSLLVEKALAKFNIDPAQSIFIGDKQRDIESANGAGVKGFLIHENEDWSGIIDDLIKDKKTAY